MTIVCSMKEDMKKNVLSCTIILMKKVTCVKVVRCFIKSEVQNPVEVGSMVT